jgi:hypothetical protein
MFDSDADLPAREGGMILEVAIIFSRSWRERTGVVHESESWDAGIGVFELRVPCLPFSVDLEEGDTRYPGMALLGFHGWECEFEIAHQDTAISKE